MAVRLFLFYIHLFESQIHFNDQIIPITLAELSWQSICVSKFAGSLKVYRKCQYWRILGFQKVAAFLSHLGFAKAHFPTIMMVLNRCNHFDEFLDQLFRNLWCGDVNHLRQALFYLIQIKPIFVFRFIGLAAHFTLQRLQLFCGLSIQFLILFLCQLTVCSHLAQVQDSLFQLIRFPLKFRSANVRLHGRSKHTRFDHLTCFQNGLTLIAPKLIKDLLSHQI